MAKQQALLTFFFVPFPQEIWDNDIELTLGEFRLLGYLLRYQVRWGIDKDVRLTDDELLNGRKGNGERLDKGCGIQSANCLRDARTRLIAKGWITYTEDNSDKARPQRFYMLNFTVLGNDSGEHRGVSGNDTRECFSDSQQCLRHPRSDSKSLLVKEYNYKVRTPKTRTRETVEPIVLPENDEDRLTSVDEFVEMYNYSKPEVCPEVAKITPKRRERYALYLALFPSMRFWEKTFELMHFSDWIRGKVGTSSFPPVARDLDWLCQKGHDGIQNCLKVYEKKYSNKKAGENGEWVADDGHPLVPKTYNLEPFVAPFSSVAKPASSED